GGEGSSGSASWLRESLSVRWLRLPQHLGLGGAMRAGLRYAQRLGHDTVVRLDGDGQHRPDEVENLLEPIRLGRADAVQGSRYSGAQSYASQGVRRPGQRVLGLLLSALVRQAMTSPPTGLCALRPA